jgi:hypothetical protein
MQFIVCACGHRAAQAAAVSLQAMNPLVKVTAADGSTADICSSSGSGTAATSKLLREQDLVIATGLSLMQVRGAYLILSACWPEGQCLTCTNLVLT